jgi:hypothetical protein
VLIAVVIIVIIIIPTIFVNSLVGIRTGAAMEAKGFGEDVRVVRVSCRAGTERVVVLHFLICVSADISVNRLCHFPVHSALEGRRVHRAVCWGAVVVTR